MTASTILLVPAKGDPHGLLAKGPYGSRPPMMWRCTCSPRWRACGHRKYSCTDCHSQGFPGAALVLAHEGKPAEEGLDRAGRMPRTSRGWVAKVVGYALGWWPDDVGALADPELPGTLVLLDADGREVTP